MIFNSENRGFSLLELVMAIAIFSMGAIAAGYLMIDASTTSNMALEKSYASSIAREGLEAISSMRDGGFTSLTPGTYGLATTSNSWIFSGSSDISYAKYTRVVTISSPPGSGTQQYVTVTSNVSWLNARGVTDNVSLTTVLTNWHNN